MVGRALLKTLLSGTTVRGHSPGSAIASFDQPAQVIDQPQDYMGSVAISNHSRLAGFASPRGNLTAFWRIDDGSFAGYHRVRDVCGIATGQAQQSFVVSNSCGELSELDAVSVQENPSRRVGRP